MKYLCQTCKPCDYLKKFEEEMAKKEQVNVTLLYVWLVFPWTQFEWFCSFLTKNFPSLQFACREGGDYHLSSWEGSIAGYLEHFVTIKNVWEKVAFKG